MKRKLWNRDYVLLLQGSVVSTIGDLMYSVAIGYWVYEKTGSSALMGVMSAISMFVTMFFAPFMGSVVDKCNRKWVLVGVDLIQAASMISVGVLAHFGELSVPVVLLAALLAAFGSVFYSPAAETLMLDIIPHDDMVRGQSVFSSCHALVNTIGSSLSGVMVAFFGVPLIVIFNGLSNAYSALSEAFVRVPKTVQQGEKITVRGILRDSRSAIGTVFSDPCLRLFVPFALIINLLSAGQFSLMLPFTMQKGFSVEEYGYLMAIWTAASLACVMLLGTVKLSPRVRFGTMAIGFSASEIFLILAYLSENIILTCACAFLGAFMNTAGNSVFNASLMLALPEENRGAILGFISAASVGGSAISSLIYGFLGDIFPLYLVFLVGSALSILPMCYLSFHPKTKKFVLEH